MKKKESKKTSGNGHVENEKNYNAKQMKKKKRKEKKDRYWSFWNLLWDLSSKKELVSSKKKKYE